jgi:hypothetical protein
VEVYFSKVGGEHKNVHMVIAYRNHFPCHPGKAVVMGYFLKDHGAALNLVHMSLGGNDSLVDDWIWIVTVQNQSLLLRVCTVYVTRMKEG